MGTTSTVSKSNRSKAAKSALVVALALMLALGGTFAWSMQKSTVKNEVVGVMNAGARLHDDFKYIDSTDHDKNIYVENYSDNTVFARVKLSEYMEIGTGAGDADAEGRSVRPVDPAASLTDEGTWRAHVPGDAADPFRGYVRWTEGGSTVYMPTFNMDNTSIEADVRGSMRDTPPYSTYKAYAEGDTEPGNQLTADDKTGTAAENQGVTHTAKPTLEAAVKTMTQWKAEGCAKGNFWVYDDAESSPSYGYAYWASAIEPGTATGLVLDDIVMYGDPGDTWYYAINATCDSVTASEWGVDTSGSATKYYLDAGQTAEISQDAYNLLNVAAGSDAASMYEITVAPVEYQGDPIDDPAAFASVQQDSLTQYRATVTKNGQEVTGKKVNWSVRGTQSDQGLAISDDGLLNVNADAMITWNGNPLTVSASLADFPQKTAQATVKPTIVAGSHENSMKKLSVMGVSQSASDYVTLDGIQWYKVAEQDGKAMIWAKNAVPTNNGNNTMIFGSSNQWATATSSDDSDGDGIVGEVVALDGSGSLVRTYLNGEFKNSLTNLGSSIQETEILTRSQFNADTWIKSRDCVFLLSEADLFGTQNRLAADARDYTLPDSGKVPAATRAFTDTKAYFMWLRSPGSNIKCVASPNYDARLDYTVCGGTAGGLRPALWVSLVIPAAE